MTTPRIYTRRDEWREWLIDFVELVAFVVATGVLMFWVALLQGGN